MQRVLTAIIVIVAIAIFVAAIGPRPEQDETIRFDPSGLGSDLDAWLAESEAAVPALKPGAEKAIVWADPQNREKTPFAIVYVHGFSATRREIHPVAEQVAEGLGANLFYTRLAGHGRDGPAMAEASMNAWINDMAEAIAIGERLGNRVIVVSTSTGATLASWAAANPRLSAKLAAVALISPNYAIHGASTGLLNMPWAETALPILLGRTRSFEPHNEEHAKWWTTSYPSVSIFSMGALLAAVGKIDFERVDVPAVFIYSPDDKVVDHIKTRQVYSRWGGAKEIVTVSPTGDPSNHVIAGDILSPSTTEFVVGTILLFVRNNADGPD